MHTSIAYEVAQRLGWPNPEAVGRGAALPDDLEFVHVDGVGTRFLENNIACCTHFAGYRIRGDRSIGRINLPNRDIFFLPGVWPEIPIQMEAQEPFYLLLRVPGYSHAFDEITFPAAWSYADWLTACYWAAEQSHHDTTEESRENRLGMIAGMNVHYVQDICGVPQHRRNEMLAKHSETESEALKAWEKMDPQKRSALIWECIDRAPTWSPRGLCQGAVQQPTPRVPCWSWRRRKVVHDVIVKGITCTAAALKYLRPTILVP